MTTLHDHRVLVVGGAHGLGAATCRELASRQARVMCADRDLAAAEELAAAHDRILATAIDVTDPDDVARAVADAERQLGGLDAVVQAAGVTATVPAVDTPLETWRHVLSVNLDGAFLVAREVLPRLEAGGALVLVGSQLAQAAVPDKSAYIASKGGIEALTRALAIEVADRDVRVVCLAPGPIRTGMLLDRLGDDPDGMQALADQVPLGRLAEPEEIARVAAVLVGPDATYLTGTTVVVDGGYRAR